MIKITIPEINELWDPRIEEFVTIKGCTITLEHSLISLDKWETKWHKPYLSREEKSEEEAVDYIRCMTLEKDVDPNVYYYIPEEEAKRIKEYIENPMTATTFEDLSDDHKANNEIITAEIFYFMMIQFGIPMEFRKWHLNKLLTLIKVCEIKTDTNQKKMSINETLINNKIENAKRRAKLHTKG